MASSSMNPTKLSKTEIQAIYPEIFDSYNLQMSVPLEQCKDRLAFWAESGIVCFELWVVPYFLRCENDKKYRPCLRLNYPYDGGKCNECAKGTCKYDSVCFICGQKGHGAFQKFPGGKLVGERKCIKHRDFENQMEAIQKSHGIDDTKLREIFATETSNFKVNAVKKPETDSTKDINPNIDAEASSSPLLSSSTNSSNSNSNSNNDSSNSAIDELVPKTAQQQPRSVWGSIYSVSNIIDDTHSKSDNNNNNNSNHGNINSNAVVDKISEGDSAGRSSSPITLPLSIELGPSVWSTPSATSNKQPHDTVSSSSRRDSVSSPFIVGSHTPFSSIIHNNNNSSSSSGYSNSISIGISNNNSSGSSSSTVLDALRSLTPLPSSLQSVAETGSGVVSDSAIASPRNSFSISRSFLTINTDSRGISIDTSSSVYSNSRDGFINSSGSSSNGNGITGDFVSVDLTSIDDFHLGYSLLNSHGNNGNNNLNNSRSSSCSSEAATVTLRYAPWLTARKSSPGTSLLCCKGVLLTASSGSVSGYHEEITVLAWPQQQRQQSPQNTFSSQQLPQPQVDLLTLSKELKILRSLSRSYPVGIARVLSPKPLPVPSSSSSLVSSPGVNDCNSSAIGMNALLSEYSDIGYLDQFVRRHVTQHPAGFSLSDLRCCAAMLTDALLHCHRSGVSHRDLRPSTILVTRPYRYQRDLLLGQFNLKLCGFHLAGLSSLYNAMNDDEQDRFTAPEVTSAMRNSGTGYDGVSGDVWSLGMIMYYLGTGGVSMVEHSQELMTPSQTQHVQLLGVSSPSSSSSSLISPGAKPSTVVQDEQSQQHYRALSERHSLHFTHPLLHDFIDRTIRPSARRIHTTLLRCHPMMWPLTKRRDLILAFTHTTTVGLDEHSNNSGSAASLSHPHQPQYLEPFLSAFEKFAPGLVFEGNGWIQHMPVHLLNQVRPLTVKNELWWSGRGLLQAIRSHLLNIEGLNETVYPQLTVSQTLAVYMREVTEQCYPRLLSLLFELGGALGQWQWDTEEVTHKWR